MEESYRKGVANHLASSLAVAVVRLLSKRRREGSVGWVLSFVNDPIGMPTLWTEGEGHTSSGVNASPLKIPRSRRPQAR